MARAEKSMKTVVGAVVWGGLAAVAYALPHGGFEAQAGIFALGVFNGVLIGSVRRG